MSSPEEDERRVLKACSSWATRALDEALTHAVMHYPREEIAAAQSILAAYCRKQVTPRWPDELAAELDVGLALGEQAPTARRAFASVSLTAWYGRSVALRRTTS